MICDGKELHPHWGEKGHAHEHERKHHPHILRTFAGRRAEPFAARACDVCSHSPEAHEMNEEPETETITISWCLACPCSGYVPKEAK